MLAFRCKNCGHLHHAEHAGENDLPHACAACGAGVLFRHAELAGELKKAVEAGKTEDAMRLVEEVSKADPAGKRLVPENWEVLADAPPERLQELGLAPQHVGRHAPQKAAPAAAPPAPKAVAARAAEGTKTRDRQG